MQIKTHDATPIADKKRAGAWPPSDTSTLYLAEVIALGPKNAVGLEIGTLGGEGASWLLETCPNILKLYTVDPYKEYHEWLGFVPQYTLDQFRLTAKENLSAYGSRVEMHTTVPDVRVDFLFIDGAHNYQNVMADLTENVPRVKRGGIVSGHDYALCAGVRCAVHMYRQIHEITAPLQVIRNDVFFWHV